jgi:hypothetical protein
MEPAILLAVKPNLSLKTLTNSNIKGAEINNFEFPLCA